MDDGLASTEALRGAVYAVQCTTTHITEAVIIVRNDKFTVSAWEDRIGFKPRSPHVVDSLGNTPHGNSRTVFIENTEKTIVEVVSYPSPASPRVPIDAKIRQAYASVLGSATHGTVIGIYSRIPLKPVVSGNGEESYGMATIYDAVGNIVADNLPIKATRQPGTYGIYWDIRNRNSRQVGGGTYLVMISATALNNENVSRRMKIGVRR